MAPNNAMASRKNGNPLFIQFKKNCGKNENNP
jgi:hypothetical protein